MLRTISTLKARVTASSGRVLKLFGELNTIVKLSPSFASALLDDGFDQFDAVSGDVVYIAYWRGMIEVSRSDALKIANAWPSQSSCNYTLSK